MATDDLNTASTLPGEITHYTALAEHWWDQNGPFWPLHQLNSVRIEWIIEQLNGCGMVTGAAQNPLQGLSVLDIGCGGGILSEALATNGARVDAIDVVAKNIAVARQHAAVCGSRVNYTLTSAEALAAEQQRYDVVCNMEVVEHVADFESFMNTCSKLVRPGGAMFVATINRTMLALLFAIFGAEYLLRWLPRGTHHYALLRKPQELIAALERNRLTVAARTGVGVNPMSKKLYLRSSEAINYMLLARSHDERR